MDYRVYKLNKAGSLLNFRITIPIIAVYLFIAVIYGINAYLNSLSGYPVFYAFLGVIFTVHMILFIYDSPADFVYEDGSGQLVYIGPRVEIPGIGTLTSVRITVKDGRMTSFYADIGSYDIYSYEFTYY